MVELHILRMSGGVVGGKSVFCVCVCVCVCACEIVISNFKIKLMYKCEITLTNEVHEKQYINNYIRICILFV